MLQKIPILTFHSIDQTNSAISIDPSIFRNIVISLKSKGYETLLVSDVLEWLDGKKGLPDRSVLLTFDDGFENIYNHAFPLLEEMEFNATVFLTSRYCGKTNDWPTQASSIPILPLLRWRQIKEMAQLGFDFQAHTASHPILTEISRESVIEEMVGCKLEIEDNLGKAVSYFAYPYGKFDNTVYELVTEHFDAACSTTMGYINSKSDRYLLERIEMYYFSGSISSKIFASRLMPPYCLIRYLGRSVKDLMSPNYTLESPVDDNTR